MPGSNFVRRAQSCVPGILSGWALGESGSETHYAEPGPQMCCLQKTCPPTPPWTLQANKTRNDIRGNKICHSERAKRAEESPEAQSDAARSSIIQPSGDPSTHSSNSLAQGDMQSRSRFRFIVPNFASGSANSFYDVLIGEQDAQLILVAIHHILRLVETGSFCHDTPPW
jgi:hypothetical protein